MKRPEPELLGFHGLVIRSNDPASLARRWAELAELTGLQVLRRNAREIVLGNGPELFVTIRRARTGKPEAIAEVHLAVKRLSKTRKAGAPDPLGGDSRARRAGALSLIVREFRRPPSPRWRKQRKPPTSS